jgi:hypothetical protein
MKWLVLLAVADALVVLFLVAPELLEGATLTQAAVRRVLMTTAMPVVVLLLVNVLPHDIKSMLVYWKPKGVLPGREAFTKLAPADVRIDMAELKKNVGGLPTDPFEQNARWYQLYKQVANEPEVADAQRHFLMYRDMAALSLPLAFVVPAALHLLGAAPAAPWVAGALFLVQYLLTALSARWSGTRFVANVLAVHSIKKAPARRATGAKKGTAA